MFLTFFCLFINLFIELPFENALEWRDLSETLYSTSDFDCISLLLLIVFRKRYSFSLLFIRFHRFEYKKKIFKKKQRIEKITTTC
jgi:hypothetical protein